MLKPRVPVSASVRTSVTTTGAWLALVIQAFWPSTIQESPSTTARVWTPPARSGAGAGFGEGEGAEVLAAGEARQVAFALRGGTPALDGRGAEAVVRGNGEGRRAAGAGDLFDGDAGGEGIEGGAAVFFVYLQAEEADAGHFLDGGPMEAGVAVDFGSAWGEFGVTEIADEAAEELLFGGEGEVHGGGLLVVGVILAQDVR